MRRSILISLGLLVVLAATPAYGQRLLGTVGAGGGTSTLVEINPATGALVQTIGGVGYLVNGMAWDAATSTLYATTSALDPTLANALITIDTTTGAGTAVGGDTGILVNCPAANSSGGLYGWSESGDDPVVWNKATGTPTVIGDSTIGTWSQGLAFDNNDVLYIVNGSSGDVYSINTTTGLATSVDTVGVLAHHGDFHPTSNVYYGIDATSSGTKNLVLVDPAASWTVTSTIPTIDNLHTLAFIGGSAPAPTITAISPAAGPIQGGITVTITGTNLTGATSVTFGGVAATITGNTATSITVTLPPHAVGSVDVVVTAGSGTARRIGGFAYVDGAWVPTLSTWLMGLLAAALAAVAVYKIRA